MSDKSMTAVGLDAFRKAVPVAVSGASSLEEIGTWLKSQEGVTSVRLADYLLKSNPPQREFIVRIRMEDGSTLTNVVNIFDVGDQGFQFHELRSE